MYHFQPFFQPFPGEDGRSTSQPNVLQSGDFNTPHYSQHQWQPLINVQLDSMHNANGIIDSNSIPLHRLHTVVARLSSPRDMNTNNLEELQWSAENSEQKPEGPLVGDMESTEFIRKQFAEADNVVYRVKSEALAQVFPRMRQIRPDGNCGWTALIFSYFEILVRLGDPMKFKDEIENHKHLNTILSRWYSEDTYVDWWEDTMNLLQATGESLSATGDAVSALVTTFNDGYTASALIQYFRMIVAAWIQDKANIYEPFVLGETTANSIADYCKNYLEMHTVEIDGIGISALCDAVLNPAGLAVKIKYLDTSPGAEANTHSLGPLDLNDLPVENLPTIWLLYTIRGPGHYDIIYKPEHHIETEAIVMHASDFSYNVEHRWSKLDQIQPRLQSATFQDDRESHDGLELKDKYWTVPGSTVFEEPITGPSGGAYLPRSFGACYEHFQDDPKDIIFAKSSGFGILRGDGQFESGTQDAGQFQRREESQEARPGFSSNTLPMAGYQGAEDQPSALTQWSQANLQLEGTLHDASLLQSTKFKIPDASSPTYASIPFRFVADEPLDGLKWNASGPSFTSEPSMARPTPKSGKQYIFRTVKIVHDNGNTLSLNPLANPNTSKDEIDLLSPSSFIREDWEPIQLEFEPNIKAKVVLKQKDPTRI